MAAIHRVADEASLFRRFFATNAIEPLFVIYESLTEEPAEIVACIADALQVSLDQHALTAALALKSRYPKPAGLVEQIRGLLPIA